MKTQLVYHTATHYIAHSNVATYSYIITLNSFILVGVDISWSYALL